ncbi:uncharacterized protein METZ01_LOCUS147580 [marine metagenome]|uniref:Uncharacterized protein n=1 Tax=marine metagenome TaxID=408172 RepID=A0A381ZZM4_9ZZZZ
MKKEPLAKKDERTLKIVIVVGFVALTVFFTYALARILPI